jgi:hypothetical protein
MVLDGVSLNYGKLKHVLAQAGLRISDEDIIHEVKPRSALNQFQFLPTLQLCKSMKLIN